jgi:hypothetical protein
MMMMMVMVMMMMMMMVMMVVVVLIMWMTGIHIHKVQRKLFVLYAIRETKNVLLYFISIKCARRLPKKQSLSGPAIALGCLCVCI